MAVYTGQVSYKNGLGRTRNVTATDSKALAMAFGVDGSLGNNFSNGKVAMLQIEGELSRNEVVIDPHDMTRVGDLDYARAHAGSIVNFGALANAVTHDNRSELVSELQRIVPNANFFAISDEARGEIVKLLIGVGDKQKAKQLIEKTDNNQALLDTIKRNAVVVSFEQAGRAGGVSFTVTVHGTTSVLLQPSRRLISVRLIVDGNVNGSASVAGAKYKENFVKIKRSITRLSETESADRNIQYDPNETITATVSNVKFLLNQTARDIARRHVRSIEDQYATVEDFNPASIKSRIWRELNLSPSDISQNGIPEVYLRQYNSGAITAIEFANMPENAMVRKLTTATIKRLNNSDVDAFVEKVVEVVSPRATGVARQTLISLSKDAVKKSINYFSRGQMAISDFQTAYVSYLRSNTEWESQIIQNSVKEVNQNRVTREEKKQVVVNVVAPVIEDNVKSEIMIYVLSNNIKADKNVTNSVNQKVTNMFVEFATFDLETVIDDALDLDTVAQSAKNYLIAGKYTGYGDAISRQVEEAFLSMDIDPKITDSQREDIVRDEMGRILRPNTDALSSQIIADNNMKMPIDIRRAIIEDTVEYFTEKFITYALTDEDVLNADTISQLRSAVRRYMGESGMKTFMSQAEKIIKPKLFEAKDGNYVSEDAKDSLSKAVRKYITEIALDDLGSDNVNKLDTQVMDMLTDEYTDMLGSSFRDYLINDNLSAVDVAQTFVEKTIDKNTLQNKIKRAVVQSNLIDSMVDSVIDIIMQDSRFNTVNANYWNRKVKIIAGQLSYNVFGVFNEVTQSGDAEAFINEYVPEWYDEKGEQ